MKVQRVKRTVTALFSCYSLQSSLELKCQISERSNFMQPIRSIWVWCYQVSYLCPVTAHRNIACVILYETNGIQNRGLAKKEIQAVYKLFIGLYSHGYNNVIPIKTGPMRGKANLNNPGWQLKSCWKNAFYIWNTWKRQVYKISRNS